MWPVDWWASLTLGFLICEMGIHSMCLTEAREDQQSSKCTMPSLGPGT